MARPRNTIETEYSLELRMEIAQWLLDAVSYNDIRARLTERGVEHLPHNSSLKAYQENAEFKRYRDEMLTWRRRAEEKRIIASAIESGGGADALADVAMFEAVEALRGVLPKIGPDSCDDAADGIKNVAKVSTAISNLRRTLLAKAESDRKHEIDELEEEHAKQIAELKADNEEMQSELNEQAAEIARLTAILDRAGLSETAGAGSGQLSPATIARIKGLYGIKD